jgi:hypothetical protein
MQHIGYSLIDANGTEVMFWGDTVGQVSGPPDRIPLPNGDHVHGARAGDQLGNWRFVERWAEEGTQDTATFDGTKLMITKAVDLVQRKKQLSAMVDDAAEATRLKYITPGAGMMLTYQEKFAQATAVNTMGESGANSMTAQQRAAVFPLLDASVGIEAATLWDVAQLVLARYAAFAQLARVIEQKRLAGKKAISDASDVASAKAAYEAITWTIS